MRAELAQSMLQALAKHEHPNYHFLFTGDKSWMVYAYDHRTRWIASCDECGDISKKAFCGLAADRFSGMDTAIAAML
jgi:hypothetical protein